MGELEDRVALVTGGAKGIGRGIVRRFVREGAKVVIADIDVPAGERMLAELRDLGGAVKFVPTDLSMKEQATGAVRSTLDHFGRIDIVVNDAIALSPNVVLEDKTDEDLELLLRVGAWATWWTMREALEPMRRQGGGSFINFYSIDAEAAAWLHADYNMTKAAIQALTRSAAMEWARYGIRANCIAPGAKGTTYHELVTAMPGLAEKFDAANPMGYVGDPEEDIAPVAVFLASDGSRYVTGETIHVDGGQHLPRYDSKPPGI